MTLTIEIGKGRTIGLEPEQLETLRSHAVVANKIWEIGLKNILSDANAGIGKRETFPSDQAFGDAAYAASMKKLEAMLRGEYRGAVRVARESADPVTAEAQRMARVKINSLAKGWEKGEETALANITAWAAAMNMPEVLLGTSNADEFATHAKGVIAAAIDRNSKRADVREAAEKAVAAKAKVIAKVDVDDLL